MELVLKALKWIGSRRPYFDIVADDGSVYMARWWLFGGSHAARDADDRRPTPRTWVRGRIDAWIGMYLAARLHHIVREDRARDFHTHPCAFLSIVVSGWYIERSPLQQDQAASLDSVFYRDVKRRAGSIAFRRSSDRHTIVAVSPGGAWTIFAMGRKTGSWGFWTKSGFIDWRQYTVQP